MTKRTRIVVPEPPVKHVDAPVGAAPEMIRRRQLKALDAASGAWDDKGHPELKQGSAQWVRKLRTGNVS